MTKNAKSILCDSLNYSKIMLEPNTCIFILHPFTPFQYMQSAALIYITNPTEYSTSD